MNGGDVDNALTAGWIVLIIFAKPAIPAKPGKRAFDNPASWQNAKALLVRLFLNDFKHAIEVFAHSIDQLSYIATIRPDFLDVRLDRC